MKKDMYEQFRDKELPPDIQAHIESFAEHHSNYGTDEEDIKKYWFTAGFFTAENIKKIREVQGIED